MIKAVIDTNVIVSAYITKNLDAATSQRSKTGVLKVSGITLGDFCMSRNYFLCILFPFYYLCNKIEKI